MYMKGNFDSLRQKRGRWIDVYKDDYKADKQRESRD